MELFFFVLSVFVIVEIVVVKDDILSEVGFLVEEFDLKGVDIGGFLVIEVKDVKGVLMEELLFE